MLRTSGQFPMPFRSPALFLSAALALLSAAFPAMAVPAHELVAEFERPGMQPLARVTFVPTDGNYYGTTTAGGAHNRGTVFRMTPGGGLTTLVSFAPGTGAARGDAPDAGLVRGADGALYGVTLAGGVNDFGTVFKVTTAGVFTTLVDFTGTVGTAKGAVPNALVLNALPAGDGNFYGTTQAGGIYDFGTAFRMTPAGVITTLINFTDTSGTNRGSAPIGALVVNGGTLYGVTQTGGTSGLGTVYKYTLASNAWSLLAEFTGTSGGKLGSYPADGLVLHPDGALYGTTEFGGVNDLGTVFRLTTGAVFSSLKQFADTDGAQPAGQLVVGINNALYGTTSAGGANGSGTIFKMTPGGLHTLIAEFTGAGGAIPGDTPRAGLSIGANAELYGTTSAGGANYGTVFKLSITDIFSTVADFTTPSGWQPSGAPVAASQDVLVPMKEGGVNGGGTLLRSLSGGGVSVETPFGGMLGREPAGALLQSADYFGVTKLGGSTNRGTFYRFTVGGAATVLTNLNASGGARPEGPLITGPDDNFYAVATEGGSASRGAILRFTRAGMRSTVISFTGTGGAAPGELPHGPLVTDADGNLYGVTEKGGANNLGTIFKVTQASVLTTLATFANGGPNSPAAGLIAGPDGNLYGTTAKGGAGDFGTVFRVTPAGAFTVLCEFTGAGGAKPGDGPTDPLLAALDGTLYGMTDAGGAGGSGTIFKVTPDGTHVLLSSLTNTAGAVPGKGAGALEFMPDGCLYGVTPEGGPRGGGTIFRFKQLGPHAGTDIADLSPTSVTFHGRAQTGGESTAVSFEYGSTSALGNSVFVANPVGPGGSPATFSAGITGLSPGQTIYYRAKGVNASGTSVGLTRSVIVPTPFAVWKMAQIGDPNSPDLGDPDNDGIPALTEYALLLKATTPDAGALPYAAIKVYAEGNRLRMMVPRDPARNDVTLEVQAAASLAGPWVSIATSANGAPFAGPGYVSGDGPEASVKLVEVRDTVNIGDTAQRFLRIRITH